MKLVPAKLAVVLFGDRLTAAVVDGKRVEAFTVDAENPAAALRAELDARKVSTRTVALGLSRALVSVKPIELPAVGGEVRDMVRFELERHLPYATEDTPFDYAPLPAESSGQAAAGAGQRVLVAAADRRLVDTALRLAEDTHLRPSALTVASHDLLALARPERGRRTVWVHRWGGGADLLFLVGPTIVSSRNIGNGDEDVVADEIQRSLASLRWKQCDAVWLSGDDATMAADGALGRLGAPVTEPAYVPRMRALLAELPEDSRGTMQLALASTGSRRLHGLDLLPLSLRPRRLTRAQLVTAGMAAAAVLLVVAALLVPGYRERQHLNRINAEVGRLDPEVRAVERVLRELERKRKMLATVDAIESNAIRPLPVLRELTEVLPNDAWLTTVSLDSKGVELTGQAAAASALIPLLENSPRLERVEFSSPVTRGRDREQFRIRATWEAGGAQIPVAQTSAAPAAPAVPAGAGAAMPPALTPPAAGRGAAPVTQPTPGAPPAPRVQQPPAASEQGPSEGPLSPARRPRNPRPPGRS